MKLIILLVVFAWSNAAKLDKTYLPPSSAQTSGGSGNFLQTPISGSSNDYQRSNDFSQRRGPSRNGFPQNRNDYTQANNFAGTGNGLARNGNDFAQNGQDFSQNNNYAQGANDFTQSGNFGNFEGRPERTQAAFERNAAILRQDAQNDGEVYSFAYETENGIVAEENGVATNGVEAQGGFSYTGDDGQVYSIRYTADQNGFVPQGDHLPTPPPIPEEILKALEQNARDEAAGIYDDGSYNEAKYGSSDNGNYNGGSIVNDNGNNFNGNTFNGNNANGQNFNNGNIEDDEDTIVTNNALLRSGNQAGSNGAYNQGFRDQHVGNHDARPVYQGAGLRNQGPTGNQRSGVNNAYLPPFATQRGQNNGRGFGRRQPSFNDRNGYQY